jgi:hypothetical protein
MKGNATIKIEGAILNMDFHYKLDSIKNWICDYNPISDLKPRNISVFKCDMIDASDFSQIFYVEYEIINED